VCTGAVPLINSPYYVHTGASNASFLDSDASALKQWWS
jgi:hypothetical protein